MPDKYTVFTAAVVIVAAVLFHPVLVALGVGLGVAINVLWDYRKARKEMRHVR